MKLTNKKIMRGARMAALSAAAVVAGATFATLFMGGSASAITATGQSVEVKEGGKVTYGHGAGNDGPTSGHFTRNYSVTVNGVTYTAFCGNPSQPAATGTRTAEAYVDSEGNDVIKYLIYLDTANTKESNELMDLLFGDWIGSDANLRYAYTHATISNLYSGDTKGLTAEEIARANNIIDQARELIAEEDVTWKAAREYQLYGIKLDGKKYQNVFWIEKKETPKPKECSKADGKFYGKDGKEVDEATYKDQCEPKPKECSKADGKFYGKDGKEVEEKVYREQCEKHTCEVIDGIYYGKNGTLVNKATYEDECVEKPKECSKKDGKFYGKGGKEVDEATYKDQCEPKPEEPKELPNTGAGEIVSGIMGAGSVTTALGYYISSRKKLVK